MRLLGVALRRTKMVIGDSIARKVVNLHRKTLLFIFVITQQGMVSLVHSQLYVDSVVLVLTRKDMGNGDIHQIRFFVGIAVMEVTMYDVSAVIGVMVLMSDSMVEHDEV